jgi:HAD superfamily hydrolase (TIGR01509 family)
VKFKAVAFDMDGLLFNTEAVYWKVASTLLARRGKVYTKELDYAMMGRPSKDCFQFFIKTFGFPETWQELQSESEALFLDFLDEGFSTMPGLYELLDHLEQWNVPKGICTSSDSRVASEVLRGQEVARRFDFVITVDDVERGKPAPDIYVKAAERFGVVASEMLVLEDSPAGCTAAHHAGAFAIAVHVEHNALCEFTDAWKVATALNDPQIMQLW